MSAETDDAACAACGQGLHCAHDFSVVVVWQEAQGLRVAPNTTVTGTYRVATRVMCSRCCLIVGLEPHRQVVQDART